MARPQALLFAGLALLALLVGVLWMVVGREPPPPPPAIRTAPDEPAPEETRESAPAPVVEPQPISDAAHAPAADPNASTVAYPVKLRLELVEPAGAPRAPGSAALGSSAAARFVGSLTGASDEPLGGRVAFVAGPNQGRVLETNSAGKFGASDLFPGLSVVQIDGPGGFDVTREVRLRNGAETPLHVGFGLPGAASGKVQDRDGKPLAGATIELDGQVQYSDENGAFMFTTLASGLDLPCHVTRQGYASYFEPVTIAARQTNDRLVFTLQPGAALDVELPEAVGSGGNATVVLMNASSAAPRRFPWRKVSPFEMAPGTRAHLEDLPPGVRIRVCVFQRGAYANPPWAEVTLQEGTAQLAVVHLEPAPVIVGNVRTRDGLIAQGARVRLESPDRVGSTVAYFGESALFLESDVLPSFPMGVQETVADHNGRFEFTSYPKQAPVRYLVATSADGAQTGSAVVGAEITSIDLVLGPATGSATLELEFPGRHQAIDVECSVQGAPRNVVTLPAGETYVIEGLAPGTWRWAATWRGQELSAPAESAGPIKLADKAKQVIHLPKGAIDGQDADTLLRAGKR